MLLRIADPAKIDAYQKEITAIGEAVNDPALFHRVKKACLNRRAFLLVSDSYPNSFSVWLPQQDHILLWVTFAKEKLDLEMCLGQAVMMAKEIGAASIQFLSVRKGFSRVAKKLGFAASVAEWNGTPITKWVLTI